MKAFRKFLRRKQKKHIDIFQSHRAGPSITPEHTVAVLHSFSCSSQHAANCPEVVFVATPETRLLSSQLKSHSVGWWKREGHVPVFDSRRVPYSLLCSRDSVHNIASQQPDYHTSQNPCFYMWTRKLNCVSNVPRFHDSFQQTRCSRDTRNSQPRTR